MSPENSLGSIIRNTAGGLKRGDAGILTCVFLSLASGLVLSALASLGAYIAAAMGPPRVMRNGMTYFYVSDDQFAVAFALAGVTWLPILIFIWRGTRRSKPLLAPALYTVALTLFCVIVGIIIEEMVSNEEEVLITAMCLFAAAIAMVLWLPAIHRARMGQAVVGADDHVNVTCPDCGYSLIGLRDLRCPECGSEFTVDELIRRQDYHLGSGSPPAKPPKITSDVA